MILNYAYMILSKCSNQLEPTAQFVQDRVKRNGSGASDVSSIWKVLNSF